MSEAVKLCVHHVGGRGGYGHPTLPSNLASAVTTVLYEADPAADLTCVDSAKIRFVSACIGDSERDVAFSVNTSENTSSIFPLNPAYSGLSFVMGGRDTHTGLTHQTHHTVALTLTTLDAVVAGGVMAPDVLSLDVQGAAYEVLSGARATLEASTLCVEAEIEFVELYQNQKTFGPVCELMQSMGFEFVHFSHLRDWSPNRAPLDWRNVARTVQGIARFFKRPSLVSGNEAMSKYCVIALAMGQTELAAEILERLAAAGGSTAPGLVGEFTNDILAVWRRDPKLFLKPWAPAKSGPQPQSEPKATSLQRLKARLLSDNERRRADYVVLRTLIRNIRSQLAVVFTPSSPLEKTLERWGMGDQAAALRSIRRILPRA